MWESRWRQGTQRGLSWAAIQYVGSVGVRQDGGAHSIYFYQKLVESPLLMVIEAGHFGGALIAQGVDLVSEQDARVPE